MKTKLLFSFYFLLYISLEIKPQDLKLNSVIESNSLVLELKPQNLKLNPIPPPLSKAFLNYLEDKKNNRNTNSFEDEYKKGYIPPKYDYISKIPKDFKINPNLPAKFDLRDSGFVTAVKDQGNCGSCWVHSAMGALESRWKKLGIGEFDLSENHLKNRHGFLRGICDSGNTIMASAYLTSGKGPVLESDDPYDPSNSSSPDNLMPVAYVTDSWYLPNRQWNEMNELIPAIKQTIYDYGAVTSNLYFDISFYNPDNYSYYFGGSHSVDHEVLLVGWDDNKQTAASQPGAWITKNSWGSDWGDNGCCYISYYDSQILHFNNIYPNRIDYNKDATLYMYDEFGAIISPDFFNTDVTYALIKFTAKNNKPITKLGTWLFPTSAEVSFWVIDDMIPGVPSAILGELMNQKCNYPGYHTFNLPTPIKTTAGKNFYIMVKYYTPGTTCFLPLEMDEPRFCLPQIETDKCWVGPNGIDFAAIGTNTEIKADLCIRAYAADPVVQQDIVVSPDTIRFGYSSGFKLIKNYAKPNLDKLNYENKNEIPILYKSKKSIANQLIRPNGIQTLGVSQLSYFSGKTDTLIYDNGIAKGYYHWGDGRRMGTRMSPSGSCKVLGIQINCLGLKKYKIGIYDWNNNNPGNKIFETDLITSTQTGWNTTDVSFNRINVLNDFLVSFNMIDTIASLGYNEINNGKSWDFDGSKWTPWNETYFIRTIVEYADSQVDTLENFTISNAGELYLTVSNITANQPWVTNIEPNSFTIAPGESEIISVTINSSGLLSGENFGALKIYSNDSDKNPYVEPVKLLFKAVGVAENETESEKLDFKLCYNFPNPFNPTTKIKYEIPTEGKVSLKIFDILGDEVTTLFENYQMIGKYEVEWDASNFSSGIYFYVLSVDSKKFFGKMCLIK